MTAASRNRLVWAMAAFGCVVVAMVASGIWALPAPLLYLIVLLCSAPALHQTAGLALPFFRSTK